MSVLDERTMIVAGGLNAANIALVEHVAVVLADESWGVDGIRSPEHWLGWQLGLSQSEARRAVSIARSLETHPVLCGMFRAGRLSIAQTAIAVSVDPSRDAELAELAVACTLSQLQLFARAMRHVDSGLPATHPDAKTEWCDFNIGRDGWMKGGFQLDPDHAQTVKAALEQCREALLQADDIDAAVNPAVENGVARKPIVRWIDALAEMARRGLDGELSEVRRDRYRVNMYLDVDDDLTACWIDRGGVPGWLAQQLSCDGRITPTYVRDGKPVSVGRTARIVPERTRRVVTHRDGGQCRVPWCNRTRGLEVHHIVHWTDGGPTDTANLMLCCPHCHHAIHQQLFRVDGDADDPLGLVFRDRFGRIIDPHPNPPKPDRPPDPIGTYEHPHGERLSYEDVWVNPSNVA